MRRQSSILSSSILTDACEAPNEAQREEAKEAGEPLKKRQIVIAITEETWRVRQ